MAFYVEAARTHSGPVLELGCGTGRILIPTARADISISGRDASDGMPVRPSDSPLLRLCEAFAQGYELRNVTALIRIGQPPPPASVEKDGDHRARILSGLDSGRIRTD
jgi:hypothetical protein